MAPQQPKGNGKCEKTGVLSKLFLVLSGNESPVATASGRDTCPEVKALVQGIFDRIPEADLAQLKAANAEKRAAILKKLNCAVSKLAVSKRRWRTAHDSGDSAAGADAGNSGEVVVEISVAPITDAKAAAGAAASASNKLHKLAARMRESLKCMLACGAAKLPVL